MTRGRRDLRSDERLLWQEVARHVRPLPGRPPPPDDHPARPGPESGAVPPTGPALPAAARAAPKAVAPAAPPLAPLERKTVRALARGRLQADATVDLHGLTQADAHAVLLRFLHRSQTEGLRLVQVVTGKGRPGGGLAEERGVLRRTVPHWLALPGLRAVVVGWEEAAPHRGGAGALYVRLRRRPGA